MICRRISLFLIMSFVLVTFANRNGHSQENIRIAHPSLSASVLCLIIANKEGYFNEEGINVEFLSIRGEIAIRTTLAGEIDIFTNAGSAIGRRGAQCAGENTRGFPR